MFARLVGFGELAAISIGAAAQCDIAIADYWPLAGYCPECLVFVQYFVALLVLGGVDEAADTGVSNEASLQAVVLDHAYLGLDVTDNNAAI